MACSQFVCSSFTTSPQIENLIPQQLRGGIGNWTTELRLNDPLDEDEAANWQILYHTNEEGRGCWSGSAAQLAPSTINNQTARGTGAHVTTIGGGARTPPRSLAVNPESLQLNRH